MKKIHTNVRERFEQLYHFFFNDSLKSKLEHITIYMAIGGFFFHLLIILLNDLELINVHEATGNLFEDPISAIYTPFSFILVFEVYQLIYHLPRSFTNSIATQYEIISLIVIRRIFKDITKLELTDFWSHEYDRLFVGDMLGFVVLFFLIYLFHRLKRNKPSYASSQRVNRFVYFKQMISLLLLPVLVALAGYSLFEWVYEIRQLSLGVIEEISDINKVFYDEFFTVLILVDVLILLVSLLFTDHYSQLIRNSGYIISTVMIRLSFSAEGLVNIILILSGVLFGVLIQWIYNQIGQLSEANKPL